MISIFSSLAMPHTIFDFSSQKTLMTAADAEENWLEVVLGEKLCELEGVQNFVEGLQKVVAQMRTYQGL